MRPITIRRVLSLPQLLKMQQTFPRVSRRTLDDDVVEDSEPEREARRQAQKLERKRRKLATIDLAGSDSMSPAEKPKIIVISGTLSHPFHYATHLTLCKT